MKKDHEFEDTWVVLENKVSNSTNRSLVTVSKILHTVKSTTRIRNISQSIFHDQYIDY